MQKNYFNPQNGLSVRPRMSNYAFCINGAPVVEKEQYKIWMCVICGWVYEEEKGCPEEGLAPGTKWEDVPEYWVCPECSAGKEDFEMIEI
jgi:rubredoxin